jgi:hypothetical protein
MLNLVIHDMTAHLGDFKPTHVTDGFGSSIYGVVHCVFDAVGRGTDQLDLFVDMITHKHLLVGFGVAPTGKSCEEVANGVVCSAREKILQRRRIRTCTMRHPKVLKTIQTETLEIAVEDRGQANGSLSSCYMASLMIQEVGMALSNL